MPPTPPDNEEASSLERLRNSLYSNKQPQAFTVENVAENTTPLPNLWETPKVPLHVHLKKYPVSVLFLGGAAVFFVLAALVAAALIFFGGRSISTEHVLVDVSGGVAIGSGDSVSLQISVKNDNPAVMTNPTLSVEFPDSARSSDDPTMPAQRYMDSLGDLAPGATAERTVRAVFFGNENDKIVLPIRIEYHTPGSNAVFVKETSYELTITSSPVSLSVETLSQTSSGQELVLAVRIRSNAQVALNDVALLPAYPSGFIKTEQSVPSSNVLIPIGTLTPGEERVITVRGTLSGENGEERVFHFTAGTRRDADSISLSVPYTSAEASVTLTKPFLATTLSIDRNTADRPTVEAGAVVPAIVSWINTLQTSLTDAQITVKLGGNALDPNSVHISGGYYRSADTTIIFNRETDTALANLAPGDTGNGSFSFETKSAGALKSLTNPTVTITVAAAGRRIGESNVPETITSTMTRTVLVASNFSLDTKAVRTSSPFANSGPFPPKVGQETTFTVVWSLGNSVNTVKGAKVTAVLPSYVRYTGMMSPAGSNLEYNDTTRTLTWNAGEVSASKVLSFQVGLLPTDSQRGTSPLLLANQQFSGTDTFANKPITGAQPDLNVDSEVTN
ncbi:MAG: hypothetical protein JWN64_469 [Parcubacteria group bacterium]|nr:hypothetical protein [Parcubacteria group bacterium]